MVKKAFVPADGNDPAGMNEGIGGSFFQWFLQIWQNTRKP
jgi:hypothetical protein